MAFVRVHAAAENTVRLPKVVKTPFENERSRAWKI